MSSPRPTIFALSSGRGPAAIAVVRISGPRAGDALQALGVKIPQPRKAGLARVRDPQSGEMIDEALALWFPAPHSETGEDVAELQLHGGRAVIAATMAALGRIEGLRPAEAGEFTRRGFENGKLDLTAVEGLADLVSAETEGQRRQAFRQMKGALGARAEQWRETLIRALALVEARIDFSDEADVPEELVAPALALVRDLEAEIAAALADGHRGERLREGLTVAIAGPPNAGKSTLLNRLARREAAIVSPYAGTTRDVIEVHLDLGGLPVTLLDTAGIRASDDPVEMEGVRRARARAAAADLVLWVEDAREPGSLADARAAGAGGPSVGGAMAEPQAALTAAPVSPGRLPGPPATAEPSRLRPPRPSGTAERQVALPAAAVSPGRVLAPHADTEPTRIRSTPSATTDRVSPDTTGTIGAAPFAGSRIWRVRNKIDLIDQSISKDRIIIHNNDTSESASQFNKPLKSMANFVLTQRNESDIRKYESQFDISATNGAGFDLLLAELSRFAESFLAGAESALVTRVRHRQALEDCLAALRRALAEPAASREELLAEELRLAAHALGRLTGRVNVEDVLDVIFRDFCIGK